MHTLIALEELCLSLICFEIGSRKQSDKKALTAMKESEGGNESRAKEISDDFLRKTNRNSLSTAKAKSARRLGCESDKKRWMMMQKII